MIKLLLVTRMLPSLGGLETMGRLIALEWQNEDGVELKVVTDCPGGPVEGLKMPLIRQPSFITLLKLCVWADAIFYNHCYIRLSLPNLIVRRPYVVSMSGGICSVSGMASKLKFLYLRRLLEKADANLVACEAIRAENKVEAQVQVNPFDSVRYQIAVPFDNRPKDFLFAGRIVEAKGCFDLVRALALLKEKYGLTPGVSVAGEGKDRAAMFLLAKDLGVDAQLCYLGSQSGDQLAKTMNEHRIILVPSRYVEPIGIVCLEGIASGCLAIGSTGGGLGDSVGPCGFTFKNGDVPALAECMIEALSLPSEKCQKMLKAATPHLEKYTPAKVTQAYLRVIKQVLSGELPKKVCIARSDG